MGGEAEIGSGSAWLLAGSVIPSAGAFPGVFCTRECWAGKLLAARWVGCGWGGGRWFRKVASAGLLCSRDFPESLVTDWVPREEGVPDCRSGTRLTPEEGSLETSPGDCGKASGLESTVQMLDVFVKQELLP